jgi:hypothetical protein
MDVIRDLTPTLEFDAVNMLFLDCLVNNRDRHGNNWEIMMTADKQILGIAPLFDHGLCLWNGYSPDFDYSLVLWKKNEMELRHFEMFEKLCQHYPDQVFDLLEKCSKIDLGDFVSSRYNKMIEIQYRVATEMLFSDPPRTLIGI